MLFRSLGAIERRYAESQTETEGEESGELKARIIHNESAYVDGIQSAEGTPIKDLMPYFKNALGSENTQFVLLTDDGRREYYRVATFDLLGGGKERENAERYIRSKSNGEAVMVDYNGKRYLTDGDRIFRIVFQTGR